MTGSGGTVVDDIVAAVDGIGSSGGGAKPAKSSGKQPTPEGMEGRRAAPKKGGRWVRRNWWRLSLGCLAGFVAVSVALMFVFPTADLARGGASWAASWRGGGHPLGSSRFDSCWAGGSSDVCYPTARAWLGLAELVAIGVGAVAVWWRVAEMAAVGEGPVGRSVRRRRQARVLRQVQDQWRFAVIELGWLSPPTKWEAIRAKLGLHPKGPFPACEIRNLRLDMIGGVMADLHWRRLPAVKKGGPDTFAKPKNLALLATALAFETGHRRRFAGRPTVRRAGWRGCVDLLRGSWLWPLFDLAAVAAGEERYVLRPREIQFASAGIGSGDALVRLAYPATDSDLLVCDTDPAPDHSRVRLALGRDVIYWDRNLHAHLGVFGPTNKGKGHILRRIAWQLLQIGQLVVMIDGQGGSEHGLFRGLRNWWWFDAPKYKKDYGAAVLAPWVLESLSPDEANKLDEVPEALNHQLAHLVYVRNQLRAIVALGWERNEIADRNLGKGWHEWPTHEQAAAPRINVLVDEGNTLLSKGSGPGQLGEMLRKEIGALIGVLLFGGRKYGIHVVFGAQILYSASWMARGMYAQLGLVSVSGSLPPVHQMMTTQISGWPQYPDEVGYGVVAAYANAASIEAVRYPPAFQDDYKPAIDLFLWELEMQEASAASSSPEPVGVA
jgi:hypothetical protein